MESKIIHGDCIEELREMIENSIDLIVIDPPYFVPAKHYATRKDFKRNFGDLGVMEFFFKEIFKQLTRVLKPTGCLYVFCDGQSYPIFYYYLYQYCKSVRPLIWNKKTSINGYHWRHQHELIIFAQMPENVKVPTGDGDILDYRAVKVGERVHPAEKPVDLLKRLVEKSSKQGDVVLDCFAGSGSLGDACKELNRDFILIEKEIEYYNTIEKKFGTESIENKEVIIEEPIINKPQNNNNIRDALGTPPKPTTQSHGKMTK